jgi:hypothetical protein
MTTGAARISGRAAATAPRTSWPATSSVMMESMASLYGRSAAASAWSSDFASSAAAATALSPETTRLIEHSSRSEAKRLRACAEKTSIASSMRRCDSGIQLRGRRRIKLMSGRGVASMATCPSSSEEPVSMSAQSITSRRGPMSTPKPILQITCSVVAVSGLCTSTSPSVSPRSSHICSAYCRMCGW